jgi:acyl-CoA thioesterase FadM
MNRIKISLPTSFSFSTTIQVRITDLNYGAHVGNDAVLSILHEARAQFLASRGCSEIDVCGIGLIMADVAIEYKKELKYPDSLIISVKAQDFDKMGFDLFYCIERIDGDEKKVAVKAKTGMILFDYSLGKKGEMTENIIKKLTE